jgi:hypothetical protein
VIVSLQVPTGTAAASASRVGAIVLGPILHLAGDRPPHRDIRSRQFEIGSGLFCFALLVGKRGPFDPATIGAVASASPDLEHIFPLLRQIGRKRFHGRRGWHRSGRLSAQAQLQLAGVIVGALFSPRS